MYWVDPVRSRKHIGRMKSFLKGSSPRDYAFFVVGINIGLRFSDLRALCVGDVLAGEGKRIRIAKEIVVHERKTSNDRKFPLNNAAAEALKFYLRRRSPVSPEEPLWLSRQRNSDGTSRAISLAQASRILKRAACMAGVPKTDRIGTHTLRKTFAYQMYKKTATLAEIKEMLGHCHEEDTQRYIGVTYDILAEKYQNLNL